jgi:DNA polymerase III subunit chi
MTEVLFYHLEHKPWEQVLPGQLSKALQRGWRCVVQVGSDDRVEPVSELLWKNEADIFLAHGTRADGRADRQPIWLTAGDDSPNNATVRFFIEGAMPGEIASLDRVAILFDGRDEAAVQAARDNWKRLKAQGLAISYWQQDENFRWVDRSKAE